MKPHDIWHVTGCPPHLDGKRVVIECRSVADAEAIHDHLVRSFDDSAAAEAGLHARTDGKNIGLYDREGGELVDVLNASEARALAASLLRRADEAEEPAPLGDYFLNCDEEA